MINLIQTDRASLTQLLIACSILQTERGREAVVDSAGLGELRPHLDLSGPSIVALPLMVSTMLNYGRLTYGQEALGAFLATLRDFVGIEQRTQIDKLIVKYDLTVLASKPPATPIWPAPPLSQDVLEKIIGENTLRPIAFLEQALDAARSVAYIEVAANGRKWSGTGFLIARNLLLTNNHVLSDSSLLAGTAFRFNYQLDKYGNPLVPHDYRAVNGGVFFTDPELDYTIVELSGMPSDQWGFLPLSQALPSSSDRIYIIQHPNGLPKQITLQNNFVKYVNHAKIQYVTSTLPGSSGSPVLNDHWIVVGLHRAGGDLPEEDPSRLYFRNEAVAMQAIVENCAVDIRKLLHIV